MASALEYGSVSVGADAQQHIRNLGAGVCVAGTNSFAEEVRADNDKYSKLIENSA